MDQYFFEGTCYPDDGVTEIPKGAKLIPAGHWFLKNTPVPAGKELTTGTDGLPALKEVHGVEQKQLEDFWAGQELAASDRCLTGDYPLQELTREELHARIQEYRNKLRNPNRSNHPDYPNPSWRPQWPEGVKRPFV